MIKMIEDLGYIYANQNSVHKRHFAIYECPYCNNAFKAIVDNMNRGHHKSCGCMTKKWASERFTVHGTPNKKLHYVWSLMKERCYREKSEQYKHYGGRGISVCDEWRLNYMSFYNWAIENGYKPGLWLDRKENDLNYDPNNCKWVTPAENCQNRRRRIDNTSGYIGLYKRGNKWGSKIVSSGITYNIGMFDSKEEAAIAYNDWVIKNKTRHTLNKIKSL